MDIEAIPWSAPGPYRVAFSTRAGGVSEGPYASLNLGLATDDVAEHVIENRRRLCEHVAADPGRATLARQVHGADVGRAEPTGVLRPRAHEERDGLWTDERGLALLVLTADCLPAAICRSDARQPALALAHAGWRGLLAGVLERAVDALGPGACSAAIGPAIGPCCFEVGDEVAAGFRARFGDDVVAGRHVDLWAAAELALTSAGCTRVDSVRRCTSCDPAFFSHRRDRGVTGRQAVIGLVV